MGPVLLTSACISAHCCLKLLDLRNVQFWSLEPMSCSMSVAALGIAVNEHAFIRVDFILPAGRHVSFARSLLLSIHLRQSSSSGRFCVLSVSAT